MVVSPECIQTNTLIFTNLEPEAFLDGGEALVAFVQSAVETKPVRLTPLKSLNRFLMIFESSDIASMVRESLHKTDFLGKRLMVYYGQQSDINTLSTGESVKINLLQVPKIERNFLLSPPGSPPVGWVQPEESGPSAGGHTALYLDLDHFKLDMDAGEVADAVDSTDAAGCPSIRFGERERDVWEEGGSLEVAMEGSSVKHVLSFSIPNAHRKGDGSDPSLPTIVVEEAAEDDDDGGAAWQGYAAPASHKRSPTPIPKTRLPIQ
ncbi:Calcipressin-domain-containing protein [Polychytrium aggregatum]|uniref:Calcipressin-domain-containing protein n=1 Tax=Polychytrium aggregatum TaxID=110093 RepID=UPI0022FE27A7|nr:Calcipressin-domain-containing protein [Polychytrium aggregatum]KAI9193435.1 Calcipressin-domain-containing protein [Polychytrium aggregatum]